MNVRVILLLMAAAIGLYVAALGAYAALQIGPAARALRLRAGALAVEYDSVRVQSEALLRAFDEVRRLSLDRSLTPGDRSALRSRLRPTVAAIAVRSVGLEASLVLRDIPADMRVALAEAAGMESQVAGALLEALEDLGQGDGPAAASWIARAETAREGLVARLGESQRLGLVDLAERERVLGRRANRVGQAVAWWVILGLALVGLAMLVLHRRLYAPLALLERGLARVAEGDLQASLPVRREDELGRLMAHFNEMTSVLRGRPEEVRFRTAFMTVPDAHYIATRDEGRILEVNDRFEGVLGYRREEVLGRTSLELGLYADPDDRARMLAELRAKGEVRDLKLLARRKGGETIPVQLSVSELRTGDQTLILGVIRDMSELARAAEALRAMEEQFRQAQRLEAVGRLAGGVAHDFNNLLTAITGYSDLLLESLGPEDLNRADVEEIKGAALRATSLTRQLLAFSRKQVLQPRVLDLNQAVRTLDNMLRRLIGEDVTLELSVAATLGAVRADPGQIEQVILNLAVNSRDAMPGGGRLTIATADVDLDAAWAGAHAGASPGRYVMLAVSDTGTGMDAETRSHIFEPFYTTKEQGKGTGLGLATVYGIVKQSGGYVQVDSEPGRGATFRIYLPRVDEQAEAEEVTSLERPAEGGMETLLLAEDDVSVRELVSEVLSRKGYRVLRAPDAKTALEMSRAQAGEIHLLVTDLVMPGMTGRELADALRAERPGIRVLYMSGYTDDAVVRHRVLEEGIPYLQKPFAPHALTSKVREVLDRT